MFRANTVFILGAGSSFDFGFPLGADLKSEVAATLSHKRDTLGNLKISESGSRILSSVLQAKQLTEQEVLKAAEMIRGGVCLTSSIDHFLWLHSGNVAVSACAKAAIAHLIYEKENSCSKLRHLKRDEQRKTNEFDKTWAQPFCEICFEGVAAAELEEALSRVKFINFNYDRCVERLMMLAIQALYALPASDAFALANSVDVIHPYGSLGSLDGNASFGQGGKRDPFELSSGLKTFSERLEDEGLVDKIKTTVADAETLVFMGFGYHKQNIEMLVPMTNSKRKRVIGTAKNVAAEAQQVLKLKLESGFALNFGPTNRVSVSPEARVSFMDCDCATLLYEHRLGLLG